MITTSRYASKKTRELAKWLSKTFNQGYFARGKKTISKFVELSRKNGDERVLIVKEKDNNPVLIDIIEVYEDFSWEWLSSIEVADEK